MWVDVEENDVIDDVILVLREDGWYFNCVMRHASKVMIKNKEDHELIYNWSYETFWEEPKSKL